MYGYKSGNYDLFLWLVVYVVISVVESWAKKKNSSQNVVSESQVSSGIQGEMGNKGYCEKCGVKVFINYGNAYTTLCKNCS